MCGIHGLIVGKNKIRNGSSFLADAFIAGSLRGKDSSGIAVIDVKDGISCYQKLPISGTYFPEDRYAKVLLDEMDETNVIAICHTRHATQGKVGLNEAHPFVVERSTARRELVGVHNGTLTGWRTETGASRYDVDSEWALNHIYEKGNDAFKDFRGAYAFVWWDSAEGDALNIALNDQRPMFVAFTKEGGMAYASEVGMLYWLLERNDIEIDGEALKLTANHHYKFDVANVKEFKKEKIYEPVVYRPGNTSANSGHYYHRATLTERVAEVLAPVINKATRKAENEAQKKLLTKEEVEALASFSLKGCKGIFAPWNLSDNGELAGTFYPDNGEISAFDAIIRNAGQLKFEANAYWEVLAIGVIELGKDDEPILICSKPKLKLVAGSMH